MSGETAIQAQAERVPSPKGKNMPCVFKEKQRCREAWAGMKPEARG